MAGFSRLQRRRNPRSPDEWTEVPPGLREFTHTHYECMRCGTFITPTTPHARQLGGLVHYPQCWDPPDERLSE